MFIFFLFYSISSFSQAKTQPPQFLATEDACFVFANISDKKDSYSFGKSCNVRTPPCSTFKVVLAEIAFKIKKVNSQNEMFKWDGKKRDRDVLNQDHDLHSWMKHSVIWVSSVLVDRIGRDNIRLNLMDLNYGDALIGPNEFWIQGPLSISVKEQVSYLSRTKNNEYLLTALKLLLLEKVGSYEVYGKTGSCNVDSKNDSLKVGWFVGQAQTSNKTYAFALRILGKNSSGARAKEGFIEWLQQKHERSLTP